GNVSHLSWRTESEINNSYFTLERSSNAIDFTAIKTISGAGTSHSGIDYEYYDKTPQGGVNYYRLSQTDFDGTRTYFDIQSVYFEPYSGVNIYPNPNKGTFSIERESNHPVRMRIIDMFGKVVWQEYTDQNLIRPTI